MYLSDYHTHSRLSFDAHAPLSELAEAAAEDAVPALPQAVRVSAKAKASARMGFLAFMVLLLVFSGQECALLLLSFSF